MAQEHVDSALPRTIAPDGRLATKFTEGEPNWLLHELCVVDGVCEPRRPGASSYEPQARQTGSAAKERRQDSHIQPDTPSLLVGLSLALLLLSLPRRSRYRLLVWHLVRMMKQNYSEWSPSLAAARVRGVARRRHERIRPATADRLGRERVDEEVQDASPLARTGTGREALRPGLQSFVTSGRFLHGDAP